MDEQVDASAPASSSRSHHVVVRARSGSGARPLAAARPDRRPASPGSACPGYTGHASPQPSVTTTSAARTTSSVSGLGNSIAHIDPDLAHRRDDDRVDLLVGCEPAERTATAPSRQLVRQRGGHLAAPGVVLAHEQHLRQRLGDQPVGLRDRPQPLAREPLDDHRQEVRTDRRPVADPRIGLLDVPRRPSPGRTRRGTRRRQLAIVCSRHCASGALASTGSLRQMHDDNLVLAQSNTIDSHQFNRYL